MLDNHDRVSFLNQGIKRLQQRFDVVEMQAGRRFVEDKQRGLLFLLPQIVSQFDALVLTTRQGRRGLPQLDVTQSDVL